MLQSEQDLTEALLGKSEEFRALYEEHIRLEQDLEALYSLKYFPSEVEFHIKELKVVKLRGKDRMQRLITEYKMKHTEEAT